MHSYYLPATMRHLPAGFWPTPPQNIFIQPILQSGHTQPFGVMVIGLNPYRLFDDKYKGFFELVGDQIATAIGNVRAYEEKRKRVEALQEIDKAKTVFFNNVSHEFRTPLTLMLGPLREMLSKEDKLLPEFKNDLQLINRNAQRLLKLVNSLLEFSRIEAGRVQANFKNINLSEVTTDLASSFRSTIEKAGLKYDVLCQPLEQATYVDPEMWEKIVLNLLSNAFKYTLEGDIKISLAEEKGWAVLKVQDTGVGIPQSELPKMFERFHRVTSNGGRTHEGTGIGLSLIQELIKMHGGEIKVKSIVGRGSIFTVRIPTGRQHLKIENVYSGATITENRASALIGAFVNEAKALLPDFETQSMIEGGVEYRDDQDHEFDASIKVLIVDDNADMRIYLKRLLNPYWHVYLANNGAEALKLMDHVHPDIVISDIMMPMMTGQDLLKAIRSNIVYTKTPVILLSARAGEESRIEGLDGGADDYLVKPFSAKELITKIRSQISLSKARAQADTLLKRLFINAPTAICILRGLDFIVDLANKTMLEMWDKESDDVINRSVFQVLPELNGQGFDELLKNVLETGQRYVGSETKVQLTRNGYVENIYVEFIYEPYIETNGNVSGVIVLAHEITDLVIKRQQAQENVEEMKRLIKQRDEFMSIASHELKTPVTSIKAVIQVLGRMEQPNSKQTEFINKANRQVERLSNLVNELLDISSLEAGKLKFEIEAIDLAEILIDTVEQHRQINTSRQFILNAKPGALVNGDRNRLEQVITNFLSNAVKYSPEADRVLIDLKQKGRYYYVSVTDFGIGIPAEKINRIFERFYRVEETMKYAAGMGLGLYISAQIIERHGGQVGVQKNESKGSIFWFTVPKLQSL